MLVTFRREGESILIGDNIEVRILDISRSKVKLGIVAPRTIPITTREMELVVAQNRQAARALELSALSRMMSAPVQETPNTRSPATEKASA